jgi:hypothetical protein
MDLNYSTEELAFRDEVRSWLRGNLPDELRQKMESYQELSKDDLLRWHKILAQKGGSPPTGRKSGEARAGTPCRNTSSKRSAASRPLRL